MITLVWYSDNVCYEKPSNGPQLTVTVLCGLKFIN